MKLRIALVACAVLAAPVPAMAWKLVYDPTQKYNMLRQLEEAKRQFAKMKEQLEIAKSQLDQLTNMHDSFNQLTDIGDLASALKNPDVTKYLPQNFNEYSGALNELLQGNVNGFAQKYDHYTSETPGNDFYQKELKRQKQETYTDMSVGQAVYDAGGKRISALETLRDRLKTAETPKEVMDLQARISAESALLQNEVLRMQGLAMVQEARNRVDEQRDRENFSKFADEARAAQK